MGTTIAILLLSCSVGLLSYTQVMQAKRINAMQTALHMHIMMESQMATAIREILAHEKEKADDSNG